jgi:hypothetical protein
VCDAQRLLQEPDRTRNSHILPSAVYQSRYYRVSSSPLRSKTTNEREHRISCIACLQHNRFITSSVATYVYESGFKTAFRRNACLASIVDIDRVLCNELRYSNDKPYEITRRLWP